MAKKSTGLGARMAAQQTNAVASAMDAVLSSASPAPAEAPADKPPVAVNIRFPAPLHRALRQIAFDEETSINAMVVEAMEKVVTRRTKAS